MDMTNWKWLNESQIIRDDNEVVIYAPGHTDWLNNPVPVDGKLSAPPITASAGPANWAVTSWMGSVWAMRK